MYPITGLPYHHRPALPELVEDLHHDEGVRDVGHLELVKSLVKSEMQVARCKKIDYENSDG